MPKTLEDLKFDTILGRCCVSKSLENIRKPKLSSYLHGVKKNIFALKWFKDDKNNIKQIFFYFQILLYLVQCSHPIILKDGHIEL